MIREQTVWVTSDDTIFDNQEDAEAHERMKEQEAVVATLNLTGATVNNILENPQAVIKLLGLRVYEFNFEGEALGSVAIILAMNTEEAWLKANSLLPQIKRDESAVVIDHGPLDIYKTIYHWNGDY